MSTKREIDTAFARLGLQKGRATRAEVIAARRRLARELHPDRQGGNSELMAEVNQSGDIALTYVNERIVDNSTANSTRDSPPPQQPVQRDHPSFTIDVLPVEACEALRIVASWVGEIIDEDPPYLLDVVMHDPCSVWCRLELVPDAGATTVTVSATGESERGVNIEAIRDVWIDQLNQLDWQTLDPDQQRPW
jgi:hypothetical protein